MIPWKIVDRLLDSVFGAVSRFSRKSPPDMNRNFGRKHFPGFASGACVYCDKPNASPTEECKGPR